MDLSQIQLWLAGLGPWGIVIGALLPIVWRWVANRLPHPPNTPVPAPTPNPSPTPLRDGLLMLLQEILKRRANPAAKGSAEDEELLKVVATLVKLD